MYYSSYEGIDDSIISLHTLSQFTTHDKARDALQLHGLHMFGAKLCVKWSDFDDIDDCAQALPLMNDNVSDRVLELEVTIKIGLSTLMLFMATLSLQDEEIDGIHGADSSEDEDDLQVEQQISSLETTYDAMAFVLLLHEYQLKRPGAKLPTLYDLVIGALEERHDIITNAEQCADRRKKLQDNYRTKKKMYGRGKIEWPFFCVMAKIRKEDDVNCIGAGHNAVDCPSNLLKVVKEPSKMIRRPAAPKKVGVVDVSYLTKGNISIPLVSNFLL